MRRLWIPSVGFLFACHAAGHTTRSPEPDDQRQVPSVLDTPVDFSGSRGATLDPTKLSEIRIGLFAPTDENHPVGSSMYKAAQLAVEQVNDRGGLAGVPLRIVTRWDSDPWRGGSKQMIKLVYEDSVWAVIGSVSGEGTHIAEQVITKAWLPLLSPVSADPTLTYIRIPWMFRLPPNDQAQAEVLVRDGLQALSLEKVGLITSTDHDGRVFAEEILDEMHSNVGAPVFHFELSLANIDIEEIALRVQSFRPEGVIVRLPAAATFALLRRLRQHGVSVPVLLPWIPGVRLSELTQHYDGDIRYVLPFSDVANSRYPQFAKDYNSRYGVDPTPSAAYTYDAVNLIVRSLELSGLSRSGLRDAIAGRDYQGVTGRITWDNAGGNKGRPILKSSGG
jgi:ABC-type branched-subunit amino acid transport system substrate-binding protein